MPMRRLNNCRPAVFFVMILGVTLLAGCRAKREVTPPDTFPVRGKVVTAGGRVPVGLEVQFSPEDPEKTARGFVQEDGTFSLQTRYMGVVCEGAAAGTYRVMLVPPPSMSGGGAPFTLPQPIQITGETTDLTIVFPGR